MIDPPAGTPAVTFGTVAARLAALVARLAEIDAAHDQTAAGVAKLRADTVITAATESGDTVGHGLEGE